MRPPPMNRCGQRLRAAHLRLPRIQIDDPPMTLTLAPTSRPDTPTDAAPGRVANARRVLGFAALATSVGATGGWLAWRAATLSYDPIAIGCLAGEIAGVVLGVIVALALAMARAPRHHLADLQAAVSDDDRSADFAVAVADIVGRTRAGDLHHDVRSVVRAARRSMRRELADYAVGAVLLDGTRRLLVIVTVTVGLLVGRAPFPAPGPVPLAAGAVAIVGMSLAHVLLSGGRVRPGDRTRWTFSSLGEIVAREDVDGVAPRRWVGTVAVIVVLDLAVALRGMSDRWTHGLAPMPDDARMTAMLAALTLVLGALYTMATIEAPRLDNAHLVARRIEETTARQSVLGAAVCVGLIGFVAGILPGSVDTADHDPGRVEQVDERDAVSGGTAVRHDRGLTGG